MTETVEQILAEREGTYGSFRDTSVIADGLIEVLSASRGWAGLPSPARVAMMMIAVKLGRLANSDGRHADSWHDIAGYAYLALDAVAATEG